MISAVSCREDDTANYLGEEFSIEVRQEDAECAGFAGDEASCTTVGDIAEGSGDVVDPASGLFPNRSAAVENAGDGCYGDARLAGHVLDGDGGLSGRSQTVPGTAFQLPIRRGGSEGD